VKDVRIAGYGILDKADRKQNGPTLMFKSCTNVLVEGILVRSSVRGWTCLVDTCEGVTFRGVKVLSFERNGDGIDLKTTSQAVIGNCFLRCIDDCISVKSMTRGIVQRDIVVRDSTLFGFAFSDGFTIGFEELGDVKNVTVSNCDILGARGGGRTAGHSAFSIVADGPGTISDVLFENLRCEDLVEKKNLEIIVTDGQAYVKSPPGHVRNVRLKNIRWERVDLPLIVKGFGPDNLVENIVFEGCIVGGKPLRGAKDARMEMNEHVRRVEFP
jgi:polygalacturonase